ncbi:hypothetical protein QQF64_005106, partial [Cirrhinus molitorella]
NAVCKSHYPICAASLDKTAQDGSSSLLLSGTIWELRMMTMMTMMKGSTCKSSRPLPPGRQQEFCKK